MKSLFLLAATVFFLGVWIGLVLEGPPVLAGVCEGPSAEDRLWLPEVEQ